MSKQNSNTCQKNKIFLSHSYASQDEFVKEYEKLKYRKAEAKELYNLILTKLQKAVSIGNVDSLQKFSKLIGFIKSIESKETLKTFYDGTNNPIEINNLVILACKDNKVEILKIVFDNSEILNNLSIDIGNDAISSNAEDETCNNAFYYAIRSSNVELLDTLITKWPGNYFVSHIEELDKVLSRAYENLKLKNVPLTDEIEIFVENKLINLRFFSNNLEEFHGVENNFGNIKERIGLVLENISLLKKEYLHAKKVDERFLFVAKFVAQNIHILKNQLKSTYDRLPWEEVEFCLVRFVSSYIKQQDINRLFSAVLNKDTILNYLENFAKQLENEKVTWGTDISRLAVFPKLKREEVVADIISNNPQFEELYNVYRQIRDAYSLEKISYYVKLASLADLKANEGQLVIRRSIQVIGQHLKNTLEFPKLSSATSELLLLTLSKNTRKIITDLHNSLSLFNGREIKESADVYYFVNVKNDIKKIGIIIGDILHNKKVKVVKVLLEKISDSKDLDEIIETINTLNNIQICDMVLERGINSQETVEELVAELNNKINDKTNYEKKLFNEIDIIINSKKSRIVSFKSDYVLESMDFLFGNKRIDSESIKAIKIFVDDILENIRPKVGSKSLKEIAKLVMNICKSYMFRKENKYIYEIICKIFCIAEIDSCNIKWIEELNSKLDVESSENNNKVQYDKLSNGLLDHILFTLKDILSKNGLSDQLVEKFSFYKKDVQLQSAVEMLVLDIMSALSSPGNYYLENNQLFLHDYSPLLIGKCLRNHLAHNNALVDLLLSDPSIPVLLNAKILTTENITTKKLGKLVRDDPSKLEDRFKQGLVIITNQEIMFIALEEGNLQNLKSCLKQGADINARRSTDFWTTLHFAAKGSNLEVVKFILDHNLNIYATDTNNQNPLHIAASFGSYEIVKFFIEIKNMDVNCLEIQNRTPILMAAINGHENIVKLLLIKKADINIKDRKGFAPLHYAVENNHINIVKILLEKYTNVDINKTEGGLTPLHIASINNHQELVKFLLANNAKVNAIGCNGLTPLHYIARSGNKNIAYALIEKGADINAKSTGRGDTPLHTAVEYGNIEIIKFLLNNGANINVKSNKNHYTPLHLAAERGYKDIVKTLLDMGADADTKDEHNYTPLHLALLRNDKEVVEVLKQKRASNLSLCSINVKSKQGDTPLHFDAMGEYKKVSEVLVRELHNINMKNVKNKAPNLELALFRGHLQIIKTSLQGRKSNLNTRGINKFTVLHVASQLGNFEIVKFLKERGASITDKTLQGNTPLHLAADRGHTEVIKVLLDYGVKVNSKCNKGFTPLHNAAKSGHKDIIDILLEKGGNVDSTDYKNNVTPLYLSACYGNLDSVKSLLVKGANVNAKSNYNITPLYAAALLGNIKFAEKLIRKRRNVNIGYNYSLTPLHIAASKGYTNIVEILLNRANVKFKNSKDSIPIELAVLSGHLQVFQIFLHNKRVNINAKYSNGYTLLHIASEVGKLEIVKYLIEKGADVNAKTCHRNTPLHLAVVKGFNDIAEVLITKGADINIKNNRNKTAIELELDVSYSNLYDSNKTVIKTNNHALKIKEWFKQILTIREMYLGPNHRKVIEVLISLGKTEINLYNYQKARELLESVLKRKHGSESCEVSETLENLAKVYEKLGNNKKQRELLEQALSMKEKHYGPNNFEIATTLVHLSIAYGNLGNPGKKMELLKRALSIQVEHYGFDHFKIVFVLINLGNAYRDLGDIQNQKKILERAIKIQKRYSHFSTAFTLNNLGGICLHLGDFFGAKELLEQALKFKEKHFGIDNFELASTLVNLSLVYKYLGSIQTVKQLLEHALKIEVRQYGPNNVKLVDTILKLGLIYGNLGDSKKKKELCEKALYIADRHYGRDNFEVAKLFANLGILFGDLGNNQKAKELLVRAISIHEKHYGRKNVAATLVNLATYYNKLGKYRKGKKVLEKALTIKEKGAPDHFGVVRTLMKLSISYSDLGDFQKEMKSIERALEIQEKYGYDNPILVRILESLSISCENIGDIQKGKECLERALAIQEKHYGHDSFKVVRILEKLGVTNQKLGNNRKAKMFLERSVKLQERHCGYGPFEVSATLVSLIALMELWTIQQMKKK